MTIPASRSTGSVGSVGSVGSAGAIGATGSIGSLFASDIRRRIEEVIKVDQADEQILSDEIAEYVVTDAIRKHYTDVVEKYAETPGKPHEGIAVWV